jgi:hypothetical protein
VNDGSAARAFLRAVSVRRAAVPAGMHADAGGS